jgi:hypothetical protein
MGQPFGITHRRDSREVMRSICKLPDSILKGSAANCTPVPSLVILVMVSHLCQGAEPGGHRARARRARRSQTANLRNKSLTTHPKGTTGSRGSLFYALDKLGSRLDLPLPLRTE